MRKWLIVLSALFGTAASAAPAWTWVDASGTVHYSDRPVPGARQIELSGAQAFGSQGSRAPPSAGGQESESSGPYQTVEVVSPADQETLWNIGSVLPVQVRFQPALQPSHRYDLLLDGQRRNLNTTSTRASLPDVFRGTHTLQVVVLDSAGTELSRSPPRTFFVQQTSALNPNSRAGGRN